MDTSRVDGVKAPQHLKTRRYAPPFLMTSYRSLSVTFCSCSKSSTGCALPLRFSSGCTLQVSRILSAFDKFSFIFSTTNLISLAAVMLSLTYKSMLLLFQFKGFFLDFFFFFFDGVSSGRASSSKSCVGTCDLCVASRRRRRVSRARRRDRRAIHAN